MLYIWKVEVDDDAEWIFVEARFASEAIIAAKNAGYTPRLYTIPTKVGQQ